MAKGTLSMRGQRLGQQRLAAAGWAEEQHVAVPLIWPGWGRRGRAPATAASRRGLGLVCSSRL